jgi:toxin ParE1/3/4
MLPIIFSPEADEDIEEAFDWYEVQSPGVEARFLEEIKSALEQISGHPKRFPVLHHPIRGAFLLKFQYTIYYELLVVYKRYFVATFSVQIAKITDNLRFTHH